MGPRLARLIGAPARARDDTGGPPEAPRLAVLHPANMSRVQVEPKPLPPGDDFDLYDRIREAAEAAEQSEGNAQPSRPRSSETEPPEEDRSRREKSRTESPPDPARKDGSMMSGEGMPSGSAEITVTLPKALPKALMEVAAARAASAVPSPVAAPIPSSESPESGGPDSSPEQSLPRRTLRIGLADMTTAPAPRHEAGRTPAPLPALRPEGTPAKRLESTQAEANRLATMERSGEPGPPRSAESPAKAEGAQSSASSSHVPGSPPRNAGAEKGGRQEIRPLAPEAGIAPVPPPNALRSPDGTRAALASGSTEAAAPVPPRRRGPAPAPGPVAPWTAAQAPDLRGGQPPPRNPAPPSIRIEIGKITIAPREKTKRQPRAAPRRKAARTHSIPLGSGGG
jgi:hypothetical protein